MFASPLLSEQFLWLQLFLLLVLSEGDWLGSKEDNQMKESLMLTFSSAAAAEAVSSPSRFCTGLTRQRNTQMATTEMQANVGKVRSANAKK